MQMKTKTIEVRHKGIVVNIFQSRTAQYAYFQVPEYIDGKRKLWSFSDIAKAKAKALEIANGQRLDPVLRY
jgi:hypothetical protein